MCVSRPETALAPLASGHRKWQPGVSELRLQMFDCTNSTRATIRVRRLSSSLAGVQLALPVRKARGLLGLGCLQRRGAVVLADAMLEPEVSSAELSTAATAGKRGNRISKGGGEITSRRSRHRLRRPATGPFACPLPLGSALDRATLRQDVSSGGWAASYQV